MDSLGSAHKARTRDLGPGPDSDSEQDRTGGSLCWPQRLVHRADTTPGSSYSADDALTQRSMVNMEPRKESGVANSWSHRPSRNTKIKK